MKTLHAFALALALCLSADALQAQQDSIPKTSVATKKWRYEFGLNVYTLNMRGGDYYSRYKRVFDNYAASGLYARYYHGKSAIRTSVDYLQKMIFEGYRAKDNSISFKTLQLAVGYQRHFGNKKVMPYVFTDLAFSRSRELQSYPYNPYYLPYGSLYLPAQYYGTSAVSIRSSSYSATPGLGLRLNIRKHIILNFETAVEFFYMKAGDSYQARSYKMYGIHAKPFRCSFGFLF